MNSSTTNLSVCVGVAQAITPTAGAAGTSAINGGWFDMAGFRGLLALITFGVITSTAVTSIKLQGANLDDQSDGADLEGTGQTIADTDDGKTFYVDLYRPLHRYIRLVVPRGTANAVVAEALYVGYEPRVTPTTHGTNVAGELQISPAAGTA
jgi:hypothetical protein